MPDLKLHIAEHFTAPVWRMEIDSVRDILFAELRDMSSRQVSFAAINLQTAETYYKNFQADESWLTGIEAAYDGVLLLHYYEKQNSPAHKGLAAYDGATHQLLWNNFNYGFEQLTINGPALFDVRFQPRKAFVADVHTGLQTHKFNNIIDGSLENYVVQPQAVPIATLPELAAVSAEPFGNLLHYLDYNTFRIVSLHARWAGQLKQLLYVFENGKPVFEDLLNANIQKMQPEAFVMYKNQLVYLKDKTELKVLDLEG